MVRDRKIHVLLIKSQQMTSHIYQALQRCNKSILLSLGIALLAHTSSKAQQLPDSVAVKQVSAVGYLQGGKALTSTPMSFFNNALGGRLAGLYTSLSTGQPGSDNPSLLLRGLTPLILVDGIPRTIDGINPEQIESITLLKDALSTAMLGNRGGNGAILITTRKGRHTDGYSFDVTAQTGLSSSLKQRQILSAADYAMLYNEALANDGRAPLYSQAAIQGYRTGSDPYLYPDVNWQDQIFKSEAPLNRFNLSSEGGSKSVNYFVSLDYLTQNGLLKPLGTNTYNTNADYERFAFRTNLDIALTSRLKGTINLYTNISDQNSPGGSFPTLYSAILNTPNSAYPVTNLDGSLGGNILFSNNIYGQSVYKGYTKTSFNDGFADLSLRREMDDLLAGLWIKAKVSFYNRSMQLINRSKNFQTFQMNIDPVSSDVSYQRYGTQSTQVNTSSVTDRNQQFFAEGSAGYGKDINDNRLDLLMVYSFQNYRSSSQLPQKFNTVSLKATYNIKDRYIFEAVGAYSGNNWYAKGKQFDFYPAAGFSWNIDKEDFFGKDGLVNTLKLRATYGKVGNADPGYYSYRYSYSQASSYFFGTGPTSVTGLAEGTLPALRVASKALKMDVGLNAGLFKNRAYISADYYRNTLSDLLQVRGQASSLLGSAYPLESLGETRYTGFELSAGWADKVGDFGYRMNANISLNNSKVLDMNEPAMPYSWMQKTGQSVNQIYGYIADGYVATAGAGPVVEGYTAVPGDIKYKDLNNDGIINQYDVTAVGNNKPFVFYGFDLGLEYKNFDLSVLFQGVANRNMLLTGLGEWAFQNNGTGNAFEQHLDRWTPQTASTATYPRLSVGPNINNNVASSYWVQKVDFLRLKNVELGYNLRASFLEKIKVKQIRLFVNGANLFTFSDMKRFDPEGMGLNYPLQRVVNGGVTVKF